MTPWAWNLGRKTVPPVGIDTGLGVSSSVIANTSSSSSSINVCRETSHFVMSSMKSWLIILVFVSLLGVFPPFRGKRPSNCNAPMPAYVNPAAHACEHGLFIFYPVAQATDCVPCASWKGAWAIPPSYVCLHQPLLQPRTSTELQCDVPQKPQCTAPRPQHQYPR